MNKYVLTGVITSLMIITLGLVTPAMAQETKIDARLDTKAKLDGRADVKAKDMKAELDSRIKMLEQQARDTQDMMKRDPSKVESKLNEMKGTVDDLESKAKLMAPTQSDEQMMSENHDAAPTLREQLMKHSEKLLNRLMAAVERQTTLTARLASRIQIMANAGVKVDEANTKLSEAQKAIDTAKSNVSDLSAKLSGLADKIEQNKKDVMVSIREMAQTTIKSIQDAQKKLLDAIGVVKKASVGVNVKAETTTN